MFSLTKEFPTKFTINRNTWLRGEGDQDSMLLRPSDGKMCCLGQIGEQCGLTKDQIRGKVTLDDLVRDGSAKRKDLPPVFLAKDRWTSPFARNMMDINDDGRIDEYDREEKLKELAGKEGITLEFIN